jgi:hypothetical protein
MHLQLLVSNKKAKRIKFLIMELVNHKKLVEIFQYHLIVDLLQGIRIRKIIFIIRTIDVEKIISIKTLFLKEFK